MDIGNGILAEEKVSTCELDKYMLSDVWGLLCFGSSLYQSPTAVPTTVPIKDSIFKRTHIDHVRYHTLVRGRMGIYVWCI